MTNYLSQDEIKVRKKLSKIIDDVQNLNSGIKQTLTARVGGR